MKLVSGLLVMLMLLCNGWAPIRGTGAPLAGNPGTSVIMLNLSGYPGIQEKAFFEELKKDNAHLGINYYMPAGTSKQEINTFFKNHRLPIELNTWKNRLQLTANNGNIFFCTPQKLVVIIIKNEKLYYFFDNPLTDPNKRGIKQALSQLSSLMNAYYNYYWIRA